MSKYQRTKSRGHLLLSETSNNADLMYKKVDLAPSYLHRFLNIYNYAIYHLILLTTIIILASLVFGHLGAITKNCFP